MVTLYSIFPQNNFALDPAGNRTRAGGLEDWDSTYHATPTDEPHKINEYYYFWATLGEKEALHSSNNSSSIFYCFTTRVG